MSKKSSTTLAAPGSQSHSHNSNEPTSALEIVAPGQVSKVTARSGLGLDAMSLDELGATFGRLDAARLHYDKISGICGCLQGLALIEIKSRLGHGNYGPWLKEHFPKSQDTASRFMRIAEEFLEASGTKGRKIPHNAEFAEVSLLGELIDSLSTLNNESIDMAHPVVQAVAKYVGDRSYTQLWLDLPDQRGGYRGTKKNGAPRAEKRTDAEIARDEYEEHAPAVCRRTAETMVELLLLEGPGKERAWDILDDEELDKLKLQAHDLYEGALASQKRRKALRK